MENMPTFVSLAFIMCVVVMIIIHRLRLRFRRPPLPPGPLCYPIIGCLHEVIKNNSYRWIHKLMNDMKTEIACLRLGSTHVIVVNSPELAREFFRKQDAVFGTRPTDSMSAWMTSGGFLTVVLTPTGDQHNKMKKVLLSHVLSPVMHQWLHEKRREEADHLVRYVYNLTNNNGGDVDVRLAARHFCGNVIRKMVFGKRFFTMNQGEGLAGPGVEEREITDGFFTVLKYIYRFAIVDFLPWTKLFDLDGFKKIISDGIHDASKYLDEEIAERVEMWQKGLITTKNDILDVMINLMDSDNRPLLSIQEIKAQITELMLASVDNPSNAVEWVIAEMINEPSILEKAVEELDQVVGKDRLVQESDLAKLNYVKACIKEAFRLHPVAPFNLPHVSTQDTIVGDYFIPKGSHVLLSRIGLGRNPRVWEDPLEFKPERHIPYKDFDVQLTDPELRMISFSSGRRGCKGVVLGTTIVIQLVASLLHGFHWSAGEAKVDLIESETDQLFMHKPLIAHATPRLEPHVYIHT